MLTMSREKAQAHMNFLECKLEGERCLSAFISVIYSVQYKLPTNRSLHESVAGNQNRTSLKMFSLPFLDEKRFGEMNGKLYIC